MSDFFKRKKGLTPDIPEPGDYDHKNKDDIFACGLERESFGKRNLDLFEGEGSNLDQKKNPVSQLTSRLEYQFSKREIAFLLSRTMLERGLEQLKEKKNG